ncbi:hypothetical protein Tco_0485214 [Tanacetum coccineum]
MHTDERTIKLLSARVKEEMWCCEHHAKITVMPGTEDRGCGYFMWMDDLRLHISSSSGSSTPPSYSPGTSTRPSYSPGSSRSVQNLGKAECSNCKFLAEKIKTLEAKIKILEGALEMEMHPEKHTLDSAAIILPRALNDMDRKLDSDAIPPMSISHGQHVMKHIEVQDDNDPTITHTRFQEEEDLNATELAQYEVDIHAKNLLLIILSDEIYNSIDSNATACGERL